MTTPRSPLPRSGGCCAQAASSTVHSNSGRILVGGILAEACRPARRYPVRRATRPNWAWRCPGGPGRWWRSAVHAACRPAPGASGAGPGHLSCAAHGTNRSPAAAGVRVVPGAACPGRPGPWRMACSTPARRTGSVRCGGFVPWRGGTPAGCPLLACGGDVRRRVDTQVIAERHVMEASDAAVVVDGHAEVVRLAGFERDVAFAAGELADELHRPGVAVARAGGADQLLAAFHHAFAGDMAIVALVLAAAPLIQVVVDAIGQRRAFHVLGLAVARARHGAGVAVAGAPAAAQLGELDLGPCFEQISELDRVVGVHCGRAGRFRLRPAETQVEMLAIVGRLHFHVDVGRLAGNGGRLDLLAADQQLAHLGDFLGVAVEAGLALLERPGDAVLGALGDPFDRRDAGIE